MKINAVRVASFKYTKNPAISAILSGSLIAILILLAVQNRSYAAGNPSANYAMPHNYFITLKTALKLALKNYPGILSQKYNYLASIYTKNESTYLYYPQISAVAGFSRNTIMDVNNNNGQIYGAGNPPNLNNITQNYFVNNYSGSLNASLMLYSFGSRYYNYMQAKYNEEGTKYAYNLTINNSLYNVIFNFASYFEDKELEKADVQNFKNTELQYKAALSYYKIGTGNLLDAETAKATMETAKAAYINSKFNLKIVRLALFNSIGIAPLQPATPIDKADSKIIKINGKNLKTAALTGNRYHFVNTLHFKRISIKLNELINKALKHNPQLEQAVFTVKSSEAGVNEAMTGYYPSLNSNFSYTGQNSSFPLNRNYFIGISVSIPIFNGFLTSNKIGYAKASLNSQLWNSRLIKNNLIYAVSGDYYSLRNQYLTEKALYQSLKASKLAYKLALKSYQVGVGSMVQLVTANAQYITSQTNYINAKYTYFYQKAKLYSDLGLLLNHYLGEKL